jgi:hypothetical protein
MQRRYITVYYKDNALFLFPEIAEQFNLYNGARLRNQDQFYAVLGANAECGIAQCELQLAMDKDFDSQPVPDSLPE